MECVKWNALNNCVILFAWCWKSRLVLNYVFVLIIWSKNWVSLEYNFYSELFWSFLFVIIHCLKILNNCCILYELVENVKKKKKFKSPRALTKLIWIFGFLWHGFWGIWPINPKSKAELNWSNWKLKFNYRIIYLRGYYYWT